jgi:hypothetical protein
MFLFLVVCILLLSMYVAQKTAALTKSQSAIAEFLQTEIKDLKAMQKIPVKPLAYGWFDDGWPVAESDEEERAPLENPTPHRAPDKYMSQMFISEYKSMPSAHQRKEYLRQLWSAGTWMTAEFLDTIYTDENEHVRAWAAAHLNTNFKDYSDWQHPVEIRNYEPQLLKDPASVVRAALWSNPHCQRLPWSLIWIAETWKEHFRGLTQLERLGLTRNPELSMRYVVALLDTSSAELNISRQEHADVLSAAAVNPKLIGSSRRTGRKVWAVEGDANSPFEEYGQMWKACLDKWIDQSPVPYMFIKYIQTTPEVKLAAYNRLLSKPDGSDFKLLREEVIRSCDPFEDKDILRIAWEDPDEDCRKIAKERVGRFVSYVGVKNKKAVHAGSRG